MAETPFADSKCSLSESLSVVKRNFNYVQTTALGFSLRL